MTESEAFAAIALATVACDGVLGKDEAHALRRHLEYRTPYKDRSESEMATLFDQLLKRLRENRIKSIDQRGLTPTQTVSKGNSSCCGCCSWFTLIER